MTLTHEQLEALARSPARALHVEDSATRHRYVVMAEADYERLREVAGEQAWLDNATRTRREWVAENPY